MNVIFCQLQQTQKRWIWFSAGLNNWKSKNWIFTSLRTSIINLIFADFKKLLKIYLIMYKPTKLKELKHLILSSWKNMNLTFCELKKARTKSFFSRTQNVQKRKLDVCKLQNAQKMHLILGEIQKLQKHDFDFLKT